MHDVVASNALYTRSMIAGGDILAGQFVGFDGSVAQAGGNAIGVAHADTETGGVVTVSLLGSAVAVSGAAISAGAQVEIGTDGQVVPHSNGVVVGRAMYAAVTSGEAIEILLMQN